MAGGVDEEVCHPRIVQLRQDMWVGNQAEGEGIPGSRCGSRQGMKTEMHVAFSRQKIRKF